MHNWIETSNGIVLPTPIIGSSGLTISTLVDGGRNANGKFVGAVIGNDKLSIDLEFVSLSPEEFMNFLNIFDSNNGGNFVNEFKIFDPRVNDWVSKEMYVGDRTGRPIKLDRNTGRPLRWKDIKAKLVEVWLSSKVHILLQ